MIKFDTARVCLALVGERKHTLRTLGGASASDDSLQGMRKHKENSEHTLYTTAAAAMRGGWL